MATRDDEPRRGLRADPLAALAEVAGHDDPERWWEDVVESRHGGRVRGRHRGDGGAARGVPGARRRRGAARGVHAPVDPRRGQGGRARTSPWCAAPGTRPRSPSSVPRHRTSGRCAACRRSRWPRPGCRGRTACWRATAATARASTRRPGTTSCSTQTDQPVVRWLSRAARLLREEGLDASAAQVVDATRLAGALAGVRDRPLAGLDELLDATRAVLCHGSDVPLELVRRELVVGTRLGEVPPETPMVPLQQDVARLQRRLRLKPEASVKELTLDLRRPNDRERSRLLHRLNLLEVPWGTPRVRERGARDVQGGVPARVAAVARARPDPREPLGHDGRGGGRGQGARGGGPAGEHRRARGLDRRGPARRPAGRARGRAAARCPTKPRWTATPPT